MRKRMEEQANFSKKKKGFMTPERKKKLRVNKADIFVTGPVFKTS